MRSSSPCRHCPNRNPGCHDRCPDYQSFKAIYAEETRQRQDAMRKDTVYMNYRRDMFIRNGYGTQGAYH